jgi:TolB-like protein
MMWIYKVVLALIILCPTSAQAARLAVLEIEQGANQEVLAQIADGLRSGALEAARSSEEEIIVITRESMLMFLKDQGVDPNCVEGECEVDTARNIGADYVIFATLLELEGTFTLSAKLYEVEEGGLLATERTRSSSLLTLIDTTPAVAGSLLAHGLGLSYTPANTSPSYSVPTTNSSADFSGGSDGLDVDQMLAQQQCDDQANAAELEQQTTDFGQEVLNQQEEMTAQWLELAPYLGLCKHVKIPSEYNACIATADEFIHWTNNLKVTLNARHKSIETTCGVRRITLPAVSQSIDIGRSLTAEASMLKGAIIYSWRQSHRTGVVHAFRAGVGSEYLGVGAAYQVGVESLLEFKFEFRNRNNPMWQFS